MWRSNEMEHYLKSRATRINSPITAVQKAVGIHAAMGLPNNEAEENFNHDRVVPNSLPTCMLAKASRYTQSDQSSEPRTVRNSSKLLGLMTSLLFLHLMV